MDLVKLTDGVSKAIIEALDSLSTLCTYTIYVYNYLFTK